VKIVSVRGSMPDPAWSCALTFTEFLVQQGIEVRMEASTARRLRLAGEAAPVGEKVLAINRSAALAEMAIRTNYKSINLFAEAMLKMVGVRIEEEGSTVDGAKAVAALWKNRGVNLEGFRMEDGSGLSRSNALTARQLASILHHASRGPVAEVFYRSLPTAGKSGTMRYIARETRAAGRVVGKSGTISGVRNYAGYVNGRSGKRYAYAILVNNFTQGKAKVKSQISRIMVMISDL
jgi:D-alanyl-D-alanine carboxypeptidase/D-alanyl-D-alanine-endopeptidase (penicillin-binding protein 4)